MTDHEQTQEKPTKQSPVGASIDDSDVEEHVTETQAADAKDSEDLLDIDIEWNSELEEELKGKKSDRVRTFKQFPPAKSFADLPLSEFVSGAIANMGWTEPTPVQSHCLPYTLDRRDVAGFAQTGTGKTGVFLVSLAHHLERHRKRNPETTSQKCKPFCIVLAPTRELAVQIEQDCQKLFELLKVKSHAVYGGTDWEQLAKKLRNGAEVLISTPGRLLDYIQKGVVDLKSLGLFVCDEVDRMFDMGFISDVEKLLHHTPEKCQKLLFSATTNDRVKELAFEYLDQPEYISVNPEELAPERIEQHALLCETPQKLRILIGLLREHKPKRAIIFTNTKLTAAWLQYKLSRNNFQVSAITGDLPQKKRIRLIENIKAGKIHLLIATDVASRGLHISDVSHVYNFDIPDDPSNYVHRIGRTARAGESGCSYTLVCDVYSENFAPIQNMLGTAAPQSKWFNKEYLEIKDLAGNPFEDNFGKPEPVEKPRYSKRHENDRHHRKGHSSDKRKHHSKRKGKPSHKQSVAQPQPMGFRKILSKLFNVFFGWLKK